MANDLKINILNTITRLKEEEAEAKRYGNPEMASGIALSRVLLEEAYRNVHGEIPVTVDGCDYVQS